MNEHQPSELGILILAAGSSSRMGRPKQLLPWKKTTLLGHTIDLARCICEQYVVVLGAHADLIRPHVPKGKTLMNKNWQQGMGTSLAQGFAFLEESSSPTAILVLVVDQPLLDLDHFHALIAAHQNYPEKICASNYKGNPGVPAIFPKKFFESFKSLKADFGARKLMKSNKDSVVVIETKGQLLDLDTPETYHSAFSRWGV